MSKVKVAESLVDAFMDGKYDYLKGLDEQTDQMIDRSILEAGELNAYQKYFKKRLAAAGKPVTQMSGDEKKAFFSSVKAGWTKEKGK